MLNKLESSVGCPKSEMDDRAGTARLRKGSCPAGLPRPTTPGKHIYSLGPPALRPRLARRRRPALGPGSATVRAGGQMSARSLVSQLRRSRPCPAGALRGKRRRTLTASSTARTAPTYGRDRPGWPAAGPVPGQCADGGAGVQRRRRDHSRAAARRATPGGEACVCDRHPAFLTCGSVSAPMHRPESPSRRGPPCQGPPRQGRRRCRYQSEEERPLALWVCSPMHPMRPPFYCCHPVSWPLPGDGPVGAGMQSPRLGGR